MTIAITIAGNVSQAAEVRHTANGDAVATWSVASNQGKDKPAVFLRCTLWGKRAKSALPSHITTGVPMTVIGTLSQNKYNDKKTGEEKTSFEVRVTEVIFQGSKRQEEAQQPKAKPQASSGFADIKEDDIPFADPLKSRAFCLSV